MTIAKIVKPISGKIEAIAVEFSVKKLRKSTS
jgi:hypothetical protein